MDFKKSLKDVVVLVVICAVFASVLAAVNSVTAPIIADRLEQAFKDPKTKAMLLCNPSNPSGRAI